MRNLKQMEVANRLIEQELKTSSFGMSGLRRCEIVNRVDRWATSGSRLPYEQWDRKTFHAETPNQEGME